MSLRFLLCERALCNIQHRWEECRKYIESTHHSACSSYHRSTESKSRGTSPWQVLNKYSLEMKAQKLQKEQQACTPYPWPLAAGPCSHMFTQPCLKVNPLPTIPLRHCPHHWLSLWYPATPFWMGFANITQYHEGDRPASTVMHPPWPEASCGRGSGQATALKHWRAEYIQDLSASPGSITNSATRASSLSSQTVSQSVKWI